MHLIDKTELKLNQPYLLGEVLERGGGKDGRRLKPAATMRDEEERKLKPAAIKTAQAKA